MHLIRRLLLLSVLCVAQLCHAAGNRLARLRNTRGVAVAARQAAIELQNTLWSSIIAGDAKGLTGALRKGADPNRTFANGYSPLVYAIAVTCDAAVRKDLVTALLKHKADPNIPMYCIKQTSREWRPHLGLYPLHAAVTRRDSDLVGMLLAAGARVQVATERIKIKGIKSCITPLHHAVRMSDLLSIALLQKHGADASVPDLNGLTPLHDAVLRNDVCALWTLARKTDVNVPVRHPDLLMHEQLVTKMQEHEGKALFALQKKYPQYMVMRENFTPLHMAFLLDSKDIVPALLAAGADPNAEGILGMRPLHLATSAPCVQVAQEHALARVAQLLTAGADPRPYAYMEFQNYFSYVTPVILAIKSDLGIFNLLHDWFVQHDLSIDESRTSHLNPVMGLKHASLENRLALVDALIRIGADITYVDEKGTSILHVAVAQREDPVMVKRLIALGASIDQETREGFTPYDYALCLSDQRLIDIFKVYEAEKFSRMLASVAQFANVVLPTDLAEQCDERIGDVSRLHEYSTYFYHTPGYANVLQVVINFGTKHALARFRTFQQKRGAINNAKGALFELNAAYHLMLERCEIKAFRFIIDGLEFDIETDKFLVECKNILWELHPFKVGADLEMFFRRHNEVAKKAGKHFLVYSRNPIPAAWKTWFMDQEIAFVEYKEIVPVA